MTDRELTDVLGAKPEKGETVAAVVGFKETELKKTVMSARRLFEEMEKLICAGKSFRAELICGAETEGNHTARVFIYIPTQSDADHTSQEH